MWQNLTISRKIVVVGIAITFMFSLVFAWMLPKVKSSLYEEKRLGTKNIVATAVGIVDHYVKEADAGNLTTKEAQDRAKSAIEVMRYGSGDYVWIMDDDGIMIMHPTQPQRNGEDWKGEKDPSGKPMIVDMINVCKSKGAGFVDYVWNKPGQTKLAPKISYVELSPKWNWVVGSGIYADDVETQIRSTFVKLLVSGSVIAVLGVLLSMVAARSISRRLVNLTTGVHKVSLGDTAVTIDDNSKDEIGQMAQALSTMVDNSRTIAEAAEQLSVGNVDITVEPRSDLDVLTHSVNKSIAAVDVMRNDVKTLCIAALEGRLNVRADASKHSGVFGKIMQGWNDTLNAVVNPITESIDILDRVAQKDLSARMTGEYKGDHDKIKQALNTAVDHLDTALSNVSVGSEQVASASEQISSGSQELAQGASEQASSLEEISSSLQEMSSMTQQNTGNAKEAKGLSDEARSTAAQGVDSMRRLSEAIDKIKASSDETAKIVKTIDEIAFQTNLLALNAAVEAARAGDAGKGFAVVAEEVRNLAMRSAEAAKDTADLIDGSVRNAEEGVSINSEVMKNLEEINQQVMKVSEVMAEIAAASDQQSQGIEQVNVAVSQMDQITQQNAANSEESASASEELAGQAQEMQSMVASFKLTNAVTTAKPVTKRVSKPVKKQPVAVATAKSSVSVDPAKTIPFDDDSDVLQEF